MKKYFFFSLLIVQNKFAVMQTIIEMALIEICFGLKIWFFTFLKFTSGHLLLFPYKIFNFGIGLSS